jgi:hypothetical protein
VSVGFQTVDFRPWNPQFENGEDVPLEENTAIVINDSFMVIVYRHDLSSSNVLLIFTINGSGQSFSKLYRCELDKKRKNQENIKKIFLYEDYLLLTYKDTTFVTIIHIRSDEKGYYFFDKSFAQDINLDNNIGIITAFCEINDTFWLGTSDGFMYVIYDSLDHINYCYPERFKPYASPVLMLTPFSINQQADDDSNVKKIVVSYGETLNKTAFRTNYRSKKVYPLDQKEFSLDRNFLNKRSRSKSRPNAPAQDSSKDLLLFWNAANDDSLENDAINEGNIRKHSKFDLTSVFLESDKFLRNLLFAILARIV